MEQTALSLFTAWGNYYVIIGSSAGALTGLQFVVIALGAESRNVRAPELGAFGTPTIVHFCAALVIAAIVSVPWQAVSSARLAFGMCGLAGVVYTLIVIRRARWQTGYAPVLEDWLWHSVFPLIAYAVLSISALVLTRYLAPSLFVIAVTALFLLFIGIHNAWDAVTYMAIEHSRQAKGTPDAK